MIVKTSLKMLEDEAKMERYCEIVELTKLESTIELNYAMSFVIGCKVSILETWRLLNLVFRVL